MTELPESIEAGVIQFLIARDTWRELPVGQSLFGVAAGGADRRRKIKARFAARRRFFADFRQFQQNSGSTEILARSLHKGKSTGLM